MTTNQMTTSELLARDAEVGMRLDIPGMMDVPSPNRERCNNLLRERREIRAELDQRRNIIHAAYRALP